MKLTLIILSLSVLILMLTSGCGSNSNNNDAEANSGIEEPSMEELYAREHTDLEDDADGYIGGVYKAENCDVVLSIFPTDEFEKFKYTINVKGKEVHKGTTKISSTNPENVSLGDIEGQFNEGNIVIQNYGNSMNEFTHFETCDDKFLELVFEGVG